MPISRTAMIAGLSLLLCLGTAVLWATSAASQPNVPKSGNGASSQIPVLLPLTATVGNPDSNLSLSARPATFGPSLPVRSDSSDKNGISAPLAVVQSMGCNIDQDHEDLTQKVALVSRGGCGFYEKVLVLQEWGALAVIVGDNARHRGLVTMFTKEEIDLTQIPSVFVSFDSYQTLKDVVGQVVLYTGSDSSPIADTMIFLLVSPLCSLSLIYGLLLFHRRYKIMKERAPRSFVESLPTRVWTKRQSIPSSDEVATTQGPEKVWVSSGECIICLEDYTPGLSKVMRLPCDHEFHAECISKWLINRRKTCPICKKNVMDVDETTPLIQRHDNRDDTDTDSVV